MLLLMEKNEREAEMFRLHVSIDTFRSTCQVLVWNTNKKSRANSTRHCPQIGIPSEQPPPPWHPERTKWVEGSPCKN